MIKSLPASAGGARDVGSNPGSGICPGEGNGNLLQYPCLGTPMDRGAWRAKVQGFQELAMTLRVTQQQFHFWGSNVNGTTSLMFTASIYEVVDFCILIVLQPCYIIY